MSAEQIAKYEDARAGRTVPAWRVSAVMWLFVPLFLAGRWLPHDWWWTFAAGGVYCVVVSLLLSPYKRRSLL